MPAALSLLFLKKKGGGGGNLFYFSSPCRIGVREHSKRGAAAVFLNIYFQSTLVKNITIILKKGVKEFFLNEKNARITPT